MLPASRISMSIDADLRSNERTSAEATATIRMSDVAMGDGARGAANPAANGGGRSFARRIDCASSDGNGTPRGMRRQPARGGGSGRSASGF
jgi:hypothetical protein